MQDFLFGCAYTRAHKVQQKEYIIVSCWSRQWRERNRGTVKVIVKMVASDFKWFLSLSLLKCSKSQLASHHHIKFSYMPFALYLVTFLERNRMAATGKLNECGDWNGADECATQISLLFIQFPLFFWFTTPYYMRIKTKFVCIYANFFG